MARKFLPKIVTANDLLEGDNVYFTRDHIWTVEYHEAAIFLTPELAEISLAAAEAQFDKIVGAYLADVLIGATGQPEPAHFREAFRTRGPSNYFHGKQAEV